MSDKSEAESTERFEVQAIPARTLHEGDNLLLLHAARGYTTSRAPVWVMRQAGRYLEEFRRIRAIAGDFFSLCRNPPYSCEVTLQPIRRFRGKLDAAIIFSDILVLPQAMGMTVEMLSGEGPTLPKPLQGESDVLTLHTEPTALLHEMRHVYEAIRLTRASLNGFVPLIGFAGAPWTLMAYMIEGGGSKTFSKAKKWLYNDPDLSLKLLGMLSDAIANHLIHQVLAGAQAVQIFDSWAGELSKDLFCTFCLPFLKKIARTVREELFVRGIGTRSAKIQQELRAQRIAKGKLEAQEDQRDEEDSVPIIVFAKGVSKSIVAKLAACDEFDVVGIDWTISPAQASKLTQKQFSKALAEKNLNSCRRVCIQGNLDPCALYASHEIIFKEVKQMLEGFGDQPLICNLGHGMHPTHTPDKLEAFLDAVREYSTVKSS